MTCTFFGHRDCPQTVYRKLCSVIEALILQKNVDRFYVGNQGRFDALALRALRETKSKYPGVDYAVVLAYMPDRQNGLAPEETLFPEGLESAPPRYAIVRRNQWMLERSDYVVTYIRHGWGGAAQFAEKAKRAGKIVLDLG